MINNSSTRIDSLRERSTAVLTQAVCLDRQTRLVLLFALISLPRKEGSDFLRACRIIEKTLDHIDRELRR